MIESIVIGHRYNGPPASGNGGYSAGLVAALLEPGVGAATQVTLRQPPPLDTELAVRHEASGLTVRHGDAVVAEAEPATLEPADLVEPVSYPEALAISARYPGFTEHPFPTCFVCGPGRELGDGLRVFPGRLTGDRTAAPFVVPVDIRPVLMWAVLDCPGGWAVPQEARPYVLGRITARVMALPEPGDECVVMGQMLGEQGRRAFVRSTVYSATGGALAHARATWVALPQR